MKKTKIWIGVAVLLMIVAAFGLIKRPVSENPVKEPEAAQSLTGEQEKEIEKESVSRKEAETAEEAFGSSTVVVEAEDTDKKTEENEEVPAGLVFPFEIPGYGIQIEAMGSYRGIYVEDGTNDDVSDVAMVQLKNIGTSVIEYAEFQVDFLDDTLNFKVSALPAGERAVVLEQQRKSIPQDKPQKCTATVVQRDTMGMAEEQVSVTDKGGNTLEIQNLSGEPLSTVRVFYKYYMEDKDMFLGGIAFSVKLTDLKEDEAIQIQPAHYASDSCRIVMVSTYDTIR